MKRHEGEDGQATIEAALMLPVLLAIFMYNVHLGVVGLNMHRALTASRYAAWYVNRAQGSDGDSKAKDAFGGTGELSGSQSGSSYSYCGYGGTSTSTSKTMTYTIPKPPSYIPSMVGAASHGNGYQIPETKVAGKAAFTADPWQK